MKYYIQAKQGADRYFLTDEKSPSVDIDTIGYLYDKQQGIFMRVGLEIFKAGYWEEAEGEIEIDDNNNRPRQPEPQT